MKILLPLIIAVACWPALSQEPVPGPAKAGEPKKAEAKDGKQKTKAQQRSTEKTPLFVEGNITTTRSKADAGRDTKDYQEKAASERWLVIFTAVASVAAAIGVIVAGVQAWFFWRQLKMMREGIDDAYKVAVAAKTQSEAVVLAERAYVKAFPTPQGVTLEPEQRRVHAVFEIRNYGNTPARVTDFLICFMTRDDPNIAPNRADFTYPVPRNHVPSAAFLVKGDHFFNNSRWTNAPEEIEKIKKGKTGLYLYGYVDYIDSFGTRHRGGFSRRLRVDDGTQQLVFVLYPLGLDFDRPRQKGEGNDWGEESPS